MHGRTFIVTGGGSGIGAATALRLSSEGANVVVAGRSEHSLIRTSRAAAAPDRVCTVCFDLEDPASIVRMVQRAAEAFGRIDGLANIAAAVVPEIMKLDRGVDSMDPALWNRVLNINLIGSALVIRETLPHLQAAGGGSIVNTSSAVAWMGQNEQVAYATSKIGLHTLTRHTARAQGAKHIRCNAVVPGKVLSETGATMMPALQKGFNESILAKMCLPRLGQPEDVASLVVFLLSDESTWITGQLLSVDGGLTMRE